MACGVRSHGAAKAAPKKDVKKGTAKKDKKTKK